VPSERFETDHLSINEALEYIASVAMQLLCLSHATFLHRTVCTKCNVPKLTERMQAAQHQTVTEGVLGTVSWPVILGCAFETMKHHVLISQRTFSTVSESDQAEPFELSFLSLHLLLPLPLDGCLGFQLSFCLDCLGLRTGLQRQQLCSLLLKPLACLREEDGSLKKRRQPRKNLEDNINVVLGLCDVFFASLVLA